MPRSDHHQRLCREVGQLIRNEREAKGVSKAKLSEISGLSRRMILFVEEGKRTPTLDTLSRLCDALAVDLEAIIREGKKRSNSPAG